MKKAKVYVDDILAGMLVETDEGFYTFSYFKDYKGDDVSLTLRKRDKQYTSKVLFPFFDGLIPEGWLLDKIVKNWKLNINDRMELLLTCCKDCIGNVRIERDE